MSDALVHAPYAAPAAATRRRALPMGYGLLVAAAVSLGLWAGVIWGAALALG